jgi:Uri superfamily endonuclease
MTLKPEPGTYALFCLCDSPSLVAIGRLGRLRLRIGVYVYVGSALGPGGVQARLAHHQKAAGKPHWHIDYLRAHTRLERIWFTYDTARREHEWAAAMQALGGSAPMSGFGSSDCSCDAHLFFFERPPSLKAFVAALGRPQKAMACPTPRVFLWHS